MTTPSSTPPTSSTPSAPSPPLLRCPLLHVPHGFSARAGGVSQGPHVGLNLDDRALNGVQDNPEHVAENRRRVAEALGYGKGEVARLDQVHGLEVVQARAGVQTGDALVTDSPDLLLAVATADCFPILLADETAGVVGAAHAGWRGTVGRIGARTVEAMCELGARPERVRAAIGVGICAAQYPVGVEVAQSFAAAGLRDYIRRGHEGQPHINLAGANAEALRSAGVPTAQIWQAGGCSTAPEYFSYRRDGGRTGRMWALIGLRGFVPAGVGSAGAGAEAQA